MWNRSRNKPESPLWQNTWKGTLMAESVQRWSRLHCPLASTLHYIMSSHSASPYAAPPESNLLLILGKVKWNQSSAGGGRVKWAAACTWAVPVEAWKISRRPTDDMKSSCGDLWKGWSGAAVAAVSEWGGETFRVPITAALFSSCASTQTNLGGGT